MSCWDILGIERTSNRSAIDEAFRQQQKFASSEELIRLNDAYHSALEEAGIARPPTDEQATVRSEPAMARTDAPGLDARDQQIARETVIQVQALLNDNARSSDPRIWKAILCEPPADQADIRAYIGDRLTSQIRPLAENGAFPVGVCRFLDDWFGWQTLTKVDPNIGLGKQSGADDVTGERGRRNEGESDPPQLVNFWPAVIGWIVGLAILAAIFSNLIGGH